MRVAGIDCGTNSIRLLIADVDAAGHLTDVVRLMEVVRLGQGVDRTGQFAPDALDRTLAAVDRYAALCREHNVENIRFAATSATRDASNRDAFIHGVEQRLGVTPQVLSGAQEAEFSFRGAASVLDDDAPSPYIVVDLGGGSTELVLGGRDGVVSAWSMNVGCVRMFERHLVGDPPSAEQVEAARADVRAALDVAEETVDLSAARGLVGLAGTVTTVTAHALDLPAYDPDVIHGTVLPVAEISVACETLIYMPRADREALGFMHAGRVDVIGAGALVWQEVVARVEQRMAEAGHELAGVLTSEHDILDGITLWAAEG